MSRYRERSSGVSNVTLKSTYPNGYSGCTVTSTKTDTHTATINGRYEEITDVVTPGYRKRIQNGEVINNPCTYHTVDDNSTEGGYHVKIYRAGCSMGTNYMSISGHLARVVAKKLNLNLPVAPPAAEASESLARLRALANIDSTPYGFLEDVFETRETLRFLRRPATSLVNLARDFVRRRDAALPFGAAAVSDVYLAYRFAATPLIRSCQDGAEAIQKGIRSAKREKRRTARGFSHDSTVRSGSLDAVPSFLYYQPKHKINFNWKAERNDKLSAGILYEVSNPMVDHAFYLGLRAKDVPEAVWAVVPWSFMVDRAIDISSAIRGLTNLSDPSVKILTAWQVRRSSLERSLEAVGVQSTDWREQVSSFSGSTWKASDFTYDRSVWYPSYIDAIPSLNLKGLVDDATKIADALALAAQLFGIQRR